MGLFSRKHEPQGQEYDPERHELIEVRGQDDQGETVYEYVRDKQTKQIIGTPQWAFRVRPVDGEPRRR